MDKYLKRTFFYIALAILCGIVFAMTTQCVRKCYFDKQSQDVEQVIVKTDTIVKYKPIAVKDTFIKYVYVKAPIADKEQYVPPNPRIEKTQETQTNPTEAKKPSGFSSFSDSVLVEIPITQKEYADTNYRAWVSGFMPNLDSIRIYQRTIERTTTPKPTRLHITLGVGAAFNGRVEPAVFVGIGWSIYDIRLR